MKRPLLIRFHDWLVHPICKMFEMSEKCYPLLYWVNYYFTNTKKQIVIGIFLGLIVISFIPGALSMPQTRTFLLVVILFLLIIWLIQIMYQSSQSLLLSIVFLTLFSFFVSICAALLTVSSIDTWSIINFPILLFIYYSVIWLFYTLIAEPTIAKITNEVLTGLYTLVFTVSSYFSSLLSEDIIINYFQNEPVRLPSQLIIEYQSFLTDYGFGIVKLIQITVGLFLPFIGLSAFSVVISSLKLHWQENYQGKSNQTPNAEK